MNWLVEGTANYSSLYVKGMELAYPDRWRMLHGDENSAVLIKRQPTPDQVTVIISGGGANGPLFPGYVADGLADAAVVGAPYGAPNAYAIYEAGKYLGREKGVLLLYNNFAGDYLNNDMAQELLEMDGLAVESVLATDDIASSIGEPRSSRSGRTGVALLTKLAGSCAGRGYSLAETAALVRRANGRLGTLSVFMDFEKNMTTFGGGFSGEPGLLTIPISTMEEIAERAVLFLTEDLAPRAGEQCVLLINRMRHTSYGDSFRMAKSAMEALERRAPILKTRVANFSNIMDVYGFELTVLCADEELVDHLKQDIGTDSFLI